jgi:type II secretory pathway pseudopilin PulG
MGRNPRAGKRPKGFTLNDLLAAVTLLGILAAIITLSLVGLASNATVQSCSTEYKIVQAALDTYMASNNLTTLPTMQSTFTNDMTGGAAGRSGTVALYNANPIAAADNYARTETTHFYYTWDQFGRITAIGSNPRGLAVTGCAPG